MNEMSLSLQLEASYRECCEDRGAARDELDKMKTALKCLEDAKTQSDEQIGHCNSQVESVLFYFFALGCIHTDTSLNTSTGFFAQISSHYTVLLTVLRYVNTLCAS